MTGEDSAAAIVDAAARLAVQEARAGNLPAARLYLEKALGVLDAAAQSNGVAVLHEGRAG